MPASRRKKKKKEEGEEHVEEESNDKTKEKKVINTIEVNPNPSRFGASSRRRLFSIVVGLFLLFYVVHFSYVHSETGVSNGAYDILWLCNFSLIVAAIGMLTQNPLIIGTAIGCVAFSHMSWMFDVMYWIFFDTFQIGRAKYLEEQEFDELWWTTLHQFWFIPLCLTVLHIDYHCFGVKLYSWVYTIGIYAFMASVAYFGFKSSDAPSSLKLDQYVFDFNTGHEFWLPSYKDAYNIVHWFDDSPWPLYVVWSILIEGVLLNGICFIFIKLFSLLLLEDLVGYIGGGGKEIKNK